MGNSIVPAVQGRYEEEGRALPQSETHCDWPFFFAGYMQDKNKRQNGNHKKIHKDAENSVCGYADGREIIE
jgi:hypothetical protein